MREGIAFALVILFCLMADGITEMYGIVGYMIGLILVGGVSLGLVVSTDGK